MKRFLALALAFLIAGPAFAQSTPHFVFGQVPTAGEWNSYFAGKQDYNPAFFTTSHTWTGTQSFSTTVHLPAATGSIASLNIPQGSAPGSPVNGDVWTTSAGLFVRINGATVGPLFGGTLANLGGAALAGATFTGEVVTPASAAGSAGFNLPAGAAPTSPVNGDLWTTASGLSARINGVTHSYAPLDGAVFTGEVTTPASASGSAGLNLPHGAAPTSPVNGDLWTTTGGLYARVNGTTVGPLAATPAAPLAWTLISTLTASNSAALTWSGMSTNYTDLKLIINGTACVSSSRQSISVTDTTPATLTGQSQNGTVDTSPSYGVIMWPGWQDHSFLAISAWGSAARPTGLNGSTGAENFVGTLASISLVCNTGNIASGSASLYGR